MQHQEPAVRAATEADIPAITAIYADAVATGTASYELTPPDETEMLARMRALTAGGHPYLVAHEDGKILGYAYAGPFRPRRAYRFMVEDAIYVDRAAHRQGVGRILLAALVAEAERRGFRQMVAVIGDGSNHSASVGLHAALGFSHAGIMKGTGYKFGRWLDTVWMQKALGEGDRTLPDREPGAPA
ncbi:GNAT family N-acetyltransferase [Afifella sp. IM 167]|uniref:GNAT family N-acetyltransferase n=1 Tax=Afifella sp. IM 167 TaxID=2033586 RepID=UPI001CCB030D|nr:GNAT family N-acetyltransferase [Afifella sp. IM 167]MBZ8132787.1 GNAT family N-acetyltransferase [Afifella sp. IM 167]